MIYIIITIHGSDDSIVFSIVAKLFLFVYFFLLKITHEPLHLAWWNFARTYTSTTAKPCSISRSEVKGQNYRTEFADTLRLLDRTMLLIAAARRRQLGRRHCYKYRSMPRQLPRTALALCFCACSCVKRSCWCELTLPRRWWMQAESSSSTRGHRVLMSACGVHVVSTTSSYWSATRSALTSWPATSAPCSMFRSHTRSSSRVAPVSSVCVITCDDLTHDIRSSQSPWAITYRL